VSNTFIIDLFLPFLSSKREMDSSRSSKKEGKQNSIVAHLVLDHMFMDHVTFVLLVSSPQAYAQLPLPKYSTSVLRPLFYPYITGLPSLLLSYLIYLKIFLLKASYCICTLPWKTYEIKKKIEFCNEIGHFFPHSPLSPNTIM
jgi:hypothetical protein